MLVLKASLDRLFLKHSLYEFPYREEEGIDPDSTLADLVRLNNDVTNSADFATIISLDGARDPKMGYALAFRGGQLSANPKDVEAIRHELGHNFGGAHAVDNKNYDPGAGYHFGYFHDVHEFGTALGGNNINYYSNPRINHPKFGVPLGRHNTNDVARYITEKRFSLNRGDESRACYTCNAYSGQSRGYNCSAADEINPKPQACCGSLTQPEPEF